MLSGQMKRMKTPENTCHVKFETSPDRETRQFGQSDQGYQTRYPDDLRRAGRLSTMDGGVWVQFEHELAMKTSSYIEAKYPDVFSDTHKEEICQGVIVRLRANNCRVLAEFRGECTLSTYVGNQITWEIQDWLRKNSDRLFEIHVDPSERDGRPDPVVRSDQEIFPQFDDSMSEEEVFEVLGCLHNECRWAFFLRYYHFFGFPPAEIRSLAHKRGVPIKNITELLVTYFETENTNVLATQVKNKEKVLDLLGRINQQMRSLDFERRSLSIREGGKKLTEGNTEIAAELKRLEVKRQKVRNNEKYIITTPYYVIAEILGTKSLNTVRGLVFSAKRQLREILQVNWEKY